jgi:hypothetical protein
MKYRLYSSGNTTVYCENQRKAAPIILQYRQINLYGLICDNKDLHGNFRFVDLTLFLVRYTEHLL